MIIIKDYSLDSKNADLLKRFELRGCSGYGYKLLKMRVTILRCHPEEKINTAVGGVVDFERRCLLCQDLMEQVPGAKAQ